MLGLPVQMRSRDRPELARHLPVMFAAPAHVRFLATSLVCLFDFVHE